MNRNDEYKELLDELDETPLKLDYTAQRALARREAKKRRSRKVILPPIASVIAVFGMFVLLVNISPTFAYAAGRIPLIRDLAQFVAMSPSLSAAVENEYVQPIGLEQSVNSITARVEYVIVDQKQLNIFYTLESDDYDSLTEEPLIESADGSILNGFSLSYAYPGEESDELRKITVDFSTGTMPNSILFKLNVKKLDSPVLPETAPPVESSYESTLFEDHYTPSVTVAEFSFPLSFDPSFSSAGEIIDLNKSFNLDGQTLLLSSIGIYPTQMRFIFDDIESNTAWMTGLDFYVQNEKGERFEGVSNGISSYGRSGDPMWDTYMVESAFFSNSKHLTLYITGIRWLDKGMERVRIGLMDKTAAALPDGVEFESAKEAESGWVLTFSAPSNVQRSFYQIWSSIYYDPNVEKHYIDCLSSAPSGFHNAETQPYEDYEGRFGEMFALKDYPYDEVWLCPSFSRQVTLDVPISIEIK